MGGRMVTRLPVDKRPYHTFLSHAHIDRAYADGLVNWLTDIVRIPVWYDAFNLPPGSTFGSALPTALESSRSVIILLSDRSVASGWVETEYHTALDEQAHDRRFRIIPIKLDDVDPPGFLRNFTNIRVERDGLTLSSAAAILKGLYQPSTPLDATNARFTYVSRGWHLSDEPLADSVCASLADAGLQLVGDAEDQRAWNEERVSGILDSCGAFAAILPHRANSPDATSQYVMKECVMARERQLPSLVVADERVMLTPGLRAMGAVANRPTDDHHFWLAELAATLAEEWRAPARPSYVFFATDFGATAQPVRREVKSVIEAVTSMPCILGEYVRSDSVQAEIVRTVKGATLVIADISGEKANVYIEVGAARAASVPLMLLRRGPPGRPAFMLRDQQVWDYLSDADLLGRIVSVAYSIRRTLLMSR